MGTGVFTSIEILIILIEMAVPRFYELFNPLIQALKELGGSGSIQELEETVARIMNLSEEDVSLIHRGNRTKFSYNLAWARTYLKRYGVLENSDRGVWALSETGLRTVSVDPDEVKRAVQNEDRAIREGLDEAEEEDSPELVEELRWQDEALDAVKSMTPQAFERLCQRLLRESGFIQVEVTGRVGDGGIDGKGIVKLGGIVSFHVIFQCKRYQDSVSSPAIRDFRGAMVGRADKGLFLTTGTFTRDARLEAQRDGAPPLDLIDGEELVVMLKEMRLGIDVRMIEEISINREWFQKI
jgi:restriction system protein